MSPIWSDLVWLQSALRDMTEGERAVFVMSEIEGLSREEIAATFLISTDEIDARLRAAYVRFERGGCVARGSADSCVVGPLSDN
jgi:DNA-directed RNA polymerase specialized sigma24 family protein